MSKKALTVSCVFSCAQTTLPDLLEESFRLCLHRILAGYEAPAIQ